MLTENWCKHLIFTCILAAKGSVLSGKAVAGDRRMRTASMDPKVYLSTRAEGGGATGSFESFGEIFAFVSLGGRIGNKGDVVKAEWIRPDGASQESAVVELKEPLPPGQLIRFWIKFNEGNDSPIRDVGFHVGGDTSSEGQYEGLWVLKLFLNGSDLKSTTFKISPMRNETNQN